MALVAQQVDRGQTTTRRLEIVETQIPSALGFLRNRCALRVTPRGLSGYEGEALPLALGFELLCWGSAFAILIHLSPRHRLRISYLGVMVMFWVTLYLIVPSIFFFLRLRIPEPQYLNQSAVILACYLHGVFILTLVLGYLISRPMQHAGPHIPVHITAVAWALLLIPTIPLLFKR